MRLHIHAVSSCGIAWTVSAYPLEKVCRFFRTINPSEPAALRAEGTKNKQAKLSTPPAICNGRPGLIAAKPEEIVIGIMVSRFLADARSRTLRVVMGRLLIRRRRNEDRRAYVRRLNGRLTRRGRL